MRKLTLLAVLLCSSAAYSQTLVPGGASSAPLALSATFPSNPKVGDSVNVPIVVTGGTGPYGVAVTGGRLPRGFYLDPNGMRITGGYGSTTAHGFTLTVTDQNGLTASQTYYLAPVDPGASLAASVNIGSPTVGDSPILTPTITGGTAPYRVSILDGRLPDGRYLNGNSVVGRYQTAGPVSYTLSITDSRGFTATVPVSGTVAAAPNLAASFTPLVLQKAAVISGNAFQGTALTATPPVYNVTPDSVSDFWAWSDGTVPLTNAAVSTYVPISGATGLNYSAVAASDATHPLVMVEKATKGGLSIYTVSPATPAVQTSTTSQAGPNLTQKQTPAFATGRSGFGQARTNGYAASNDGTGADVLPTGQQTWTIETSLSLTPAPTITTYATRITGRFSIGVGSSGDGRLVASYWDTTGTERFFNGGSVTGGGTNPVITDGNPHFVKEVADMASKTVKLIYDGAVIGTSDFSATASLAPTANAGTSAFSLGSQSNSPTPKWLGPIDYVAVWNNAQPVTSPSASYVGSENGLIALYNLEGNWNAQTYGPIAPALQTAPTLTSNYNYVGSTICVANAGIYKNSPLSYSYQWNWADGTAISGETTACHVNTATDASKTGIKAAVTATNGAGSTTNFSDTQVIKPTPTRFLIATSRFRWARDIPGVTDMSSNRVVAGTDDYGYRKDHFRTGNSTTNIRFILHNGALGPSGIVSNPSAVDIRQMRFTCGAVVTGANTSAGAAITPTANLTLAGGVFGGDMQYVTPQAALPTNTDCTAETWDHVAAGGRRVYQYAGDNLPDEAGYTNGAAFDGVGQTATAAGVSTYIIAAVAQGLTGPSAIEVNDSTGDQAYIIPGGYDSGVIVRPSMADPTTGGGMIPTQGTIRYSGYLYAFQNDNVNSCGCQGFIKGFEKMSALLGQPDWPFNTAVVGEWRNFPESGGENSVTSSFYDAIRTRSPGTLLFQLNPWQYTLTTGNDFGATEAPQTAQADAPRTAFMAWGKAGAGGRIQGSFTIQDYFKGSTAPNLWPNPGINVTLVNGVTNANPNSVVLSGPVPLGGGLVYNPGSTTSGSEAAFAPNITSVTQISGGYQVTTASGIGSLKTYAAGTPMTVSYSFDETHPQRAAAAFVKPYYDVNLKPVIRAYATAAGY